MRSLLLLPVLALLALGQAQTAEAKTLRMAYDSDPTSLDPHEQLSGATLQLSHLLFKLEKRNFWPRALHKR